MKRVETTTKGFSKATQKQIVELLPNARTFKGTKVGYDLHVSIFDADKVKIAYWRAYRSGDRNGIIRIL